MGLGSNCFTSFVENSYYYRLLGSALIYEFGDFSVGRPRPIKIVVGRVIGKSLHVTAVRVYRVGVREHERHPRQNYGSNLNRVPIELEQPGVPGIPSTL